ncbi:MAG TPA: serine/threonine-protein kinase [Kofleriaceae bacterium]|nr:serine/threonine-protein kinase [Kofleriaceae bacterium]
MAERVARAELPPRIGRHGVLGYLAGGGMAEIFLGREPEGRPVVIKRILPHLARQQSFVAMFIDEARINSLVHHPNVVEVFELGQVGSDLFMVMEYLAGESVSGLLRRLVTRGEKLPYALAVHVIAQACAGLHAAHELADDTGRRLGVVHRDVSPQNIFVTYTGGVKVLDFGIATAAHRLTHTATGQVKGKFSYMSPEQCRGELLDLRSDIFSLGVVLYELTTQRRLFKRPNELMVLKAVTEDAIPRPRREVPDYPEALEHVCMRALARDRTRRYASALDMRHDLLAAVPPLAEPERVLADRMAELFAERIVEKRQMLSHMRQGTDLGILPAPEVDESVEVPQVVEHTGTPSSQVAPSRARRGWVIAGSALVVLAGSALAWQLDQRDDEPPPAAAIAPAPPPPPAPPPAPPAPVAAPAIDASTAVALHVTSVPSGAAVYVDGERVGTTPFDVHLEHPRAIELRLELASYAPLSQRLTVDRDQDLLVELVAAPRPVHAAPPAKKKKPKRDDPFERFD